MIKNYLVTAFRNLWRSKSSALINLSGLIIGITTSLILFLLVRHQSSYDEFHTKHNRIYRVVTSMDGNEGRNYSAGVYPLLPDAFKNDFLEAQEVVFMSYRAGSIISVPEKNGESKKYQEKKGIVYTDPAFFKIFDRKLLIGNPEKSLDEPNEAILSRKLALKYFNSENPIGQIISFDKKDFKITAIMEDYPDNTDLPFDIMLSYITIKKERDESQGWHGIWSDENCYFLLKENTSVGEIERRSPAFMKKYLGEKDRDHTLIEIQSLSSVHFDERFGNYNYKTISQQELIALGIIGVFLIITACINFINLATAEAIKRSKEVGIRKTMGSTRGQLIFQFLGESSLLTVVAMLLSIGFCAIGLSYLNPFLDLRLSLEIFDLQIWLIMLGITIFVSLLSGLYPSIIVSGFKPVIAINNQANNKYSSGYTLRRVLVVFQFFISQFLVIGSIVLIHQMNYFRTKDLGFKREAILEIPIPEKETPGADPSSSKMRTLRNEISALKDVGLASLCSTPPSSGSVSSTDFTIEGKEEHFGTQVKLIDNNYLMLFDLKLVAGTNVYDLDTAQGFIVNEKLATMVGFKNPEEMIGKTMTMWKKNLPVVGVVKNFHTVSLRDPIEATTMLNRIRNYETLSIRINPVNLQSTIKEIQQKWETAYPQSIFSFQFLDDEIKEFYEWEEKMSVLLGIFTSLVIAIGCLGLFGLVTFMAHQKTKEVGVRKVLGASVSHIVFLFSKEYLILILIGFLFAAPIAWYVTSQWLNSFTFKITIGPTIFLTDLGITLLIALLTVGYRSLKAAKANPVKSLRSE